MSREMITRRDNLPASLTRPMQDMELVRQADMIAFDEASEIYAYNFNRAASTLTFTSLVYEAAKSRGLLPDAEDGFRELTQEYLSAAKSITHLANTEIILTLGQAVITNANSGTGNGGVSPIARLRS